MKKNDSEQKNQVPKEKLSKSAMRRQREREQRYGTILRAAEILFARDGYHQTSIEQIADKSEVSVGTVYFYFKNKEDLLVQLLDNIGFKIREMLGAEFKKERVSMQDFKNSGRVFFEDICLKHQESITIFLRESVGQSTHVEKHRKKIFDRLIGDVREALLRMAGDGATCFKSELAPEVIAVSIMGMFERIAYQSLIWQNRTRDLKEIGRDAVDFIIGGITGLLE